MQDLEAAAHRAIAAGAKDVTTIEVYPWGERAFYGRDPFDNPICFVLPGTEFRGGRFVK